MSGEEKPSLQPLNENPQIAGPASRAAARPPASKPGTPEPSKDHRRPQTLLDLGATAALALAPLGSIAATLYASQTNTNAHRRMWALRGRQESRPSPRGARRHPLHHRTRRRRGGQKPRGGGHARPPRTSALGRRVRPGDSFGGRPPTEEVQQVRSVGAAGASAATRGVETAGESARRGLSSAERPGARAALGRARAGRRGRARRGEGERGATQRGGESRREAVGIAAGLRRAPSPDVTSRARATRTPPSQRFTSQRRRAADAGRSTIPWRFFFCPGHHSTPEAQPIRRKEG